MQVELLLFAGAREAVGSDRITVELADNATIADLRIALAEQHSGLASSIDSCRFAVDGEFVDNETSVDTAIEIALIPPVSGG